VRGTVEALRPFTDVPPNRPRGASLGCPAITETHQRPPRNGSTEASRHHLARWLLRARDLSGSDRLELTQEFLAEMLGVRRSSVSPVAHERQRAGLIRYSRGRIDIIDLKGLQSASCECYGTVKAHYDRLLNHSLPK
jgi:Crp-like helix-turn-helix domain